jgi:quercetin dioxygenase-like cupin family protein
MLSSRPLEVGDLRGVIFTFEKAGDVLAKHVHTEADVHITIVASGRIRAYSHDWSKEIAAPDAVDFRVGEPHEIAALEDGTVIYNIQKKTRTEGACCALAVGGA